MSGRCRYTFELDNYDSNAEAGRSDELPWVCPHETYKDHNFCVFHIEDQNPDISPSTEELSTSVRELIESKDITDKVLYGAFIRNIDLSYSDIKSGSNHPISFNHSVFEHMNMSYSNIHQPLVFQNCIIESYDSYSAEYDCDVMFLNVSWNYSDSDISYPDPEYNIVTGNFECDADFRETVFHSELTMNYVYFDDTVTFRGATFRGDTRFNFCKFNHFTSFLSCVFGGRADFSRSVFHDWGQLSNSHFIEQCTFEGTIFGGKAAFTSSSFDNTALFTASKFTSGASFDYTIFDQDLVLDNAITCGRMYMYHAQIERLAVNRMQTSTIAGNILNHASFEGWFLPLEPQDYHMDLTTIDDIEGLGFQQDQSIFDKEFDLEEAYVQRGEINKPDEKLFFNMESASIGDVQLKPPECITKQFQFLRTNLTNFDFSRYKREFRSVNWSIHKKRSNEGSPKINAIESTYLKAKNGADFSGDTEAASEFLLKEFRYRRKKHWINQNYAKWVFNLLFDLTSGYGERTSRVVLTSISVVVIFTAIYQYFFYRTMDLINGLTASSILSVQSFVTLVFGGENNLTQPTLRFLAAIEGFFGVFLIALFVFTLTKTVRH